MSGYDPKKVYIGGCTSATEEALSATFQHYGTIDRLWVAKSPPGFAFVWFGDERDAADAVAGLDGTEIGPDRVTVAIAKGKGDRAPRDGPGARAAARHARRRRRPRRGDEPGAPRPRRPKAPAASASSSAACPRAATGASSRTRPKRDATRVVEFSSEEDRRRCIDDFDNTTLRGSRLARTAYRDDYDDRAPPPRPTTTLRAPPRRPSRRATRYYEPPGAPLLRRRPLRPPPGLRRPLRRPLRGPRPPPTLPRRPRGRRDDATTTAAAPPPTGPVLDRYDPARRAEPPPRDYDAPPAPYDDRAYRR
ncbi:hypothetical protein JL722_10772 [Aureococcus anophagefferens]|nr:hypothetical protein JL722_10772 [Aureococcus anophagefferens]